MNYARILRMAQSGVVGAARCSAQPGEDAENADALGFALLPSGPAPGVNATLDLLAGKPGYNAS